jgi:hypothetical protein
VILPYDFKGGLLQELHVTPLKLVSANPVESLAIYSFKVACD